MISKWNLISEETARAIEAMIRKAMPEEYNKTRQGRHPLWVLAQCNSDFPLTTTNPDGSQRDQLYPATIIQASAGQIYPPTDADRADLYGAPVLLTVLGGSPGVHSTDPVTQQPFYVRPKRGRLYPGILTGEATIDKTGALLEIAGRSRVIAADVHGYPQNWKGFVRAGDTTFLSSGGSVTGVTVGGVTGLTQGDRVALFNTVSVPSSAGIYVVGAGGGLSLADDFDNPDEMTGATVVVTEGDFAGTMWECVTPPPITVGVTALKWVQVDRTWWKKPVRFVSSATVLAGAVVDGVTAAAGDRYVVWSVGQAARIYVVQASGGSHLSYDGYNDETMNGAVVLVKEGTLHNGVSYKFKFVGVGVFDMTPFSISGGPGTNNHLVAWDGTIKLRDTGVTEGSGYLSGSGWGIAPGKHGNAITISTTTGGTPVGTYQCIIGSAFGGPMFGPGVAFGELLSGAGFGNAVWTNRQGLWTGSPAPQQLVLSGFDGTPAVASFPPTTVVVIGKLACYDGVVTYEEGKTGVLGPGAEAMGGIIIDAGTGTFPSNGANTFTGPQTINSPTAPALNVQQTANNASDTIRVRNIAGTTTFSVTGNGDVAASGNMAVVGTVTSTAGFSGPGGSLTGLNATELTSGTIPNARLGTIDLGSI